MIPFCYAIDPVDVLDREEAMSHSLRCDCLRFLDGCNMICLGEVFIWFEHNPFYTSAIFTKWRTCLP